MKVIKKNKKLLVSLIILVMFIIMGNRLMFGVWNPFSLPDRINCYGRRYYSSSLGPITMSGSQTPEYVLGCWNCEGKSIYSMELKENLVPTIIYLKVANGQYQIYTLSGSN